MDEMVLNAKVFRRHNTEGAAAHPGNFSGKQTGGRRGRADKPRTAGMWRKLKREEKVGETKQEPAGVNQTEKGR